jgi:hypothetical protein
MGLLVLATATRRAWREGSRVVWRGLGGRHRLGMVCALVYLAFASREVPVLTSLTREPLAPLLLAWLLCTFVPDGRAWRPPTRRGWTLGVAMLLAGVAACSLDGVAYYRGKPATVLAGDQGQMFAWQRRKPFTPAWFQDALDIVRTNRDRIAGRSIACVPEGAWINALLGLDWPTRDTQWMSFCQDWILEDLQDRPPAFLLVTEPLTQADHRLDDVHDRITREYVALERNVSGMVLYRRRALEEPAEKSSTYGVHP